MIQSRLFILRDNGRIPNGFFCSLEGHIGKGMPFVGMFQMKVNNLSPSRSPLAKGTCDGHFTEPPAFWGFTFLKTLTICVCVLPGVQSLLGCGGLLRQRLYCVGQI